MEVYSSDLTMKASEICSLTVPELVTKIFCVDWSDDNQISLITSKGIHILELQPNPLCAYPTPKFKRSFLYPSSSIPCEPFLPFINSLVNTFDREDVYLSILEEGLTPKLPDRSDCIPRIISAAWSPIKLIEPSKCLLTTVTSIGSVDLAYNVDKNWFSICNLSTLWFTIIKTELDFTVENFDKNLINAEMFKKNLRRLQTTSVTWSQLFKHSSVTFSYLVTGFRSCDIAIWKIKQLKQLKLEIKPELIYKTQLNIDTRITEMLWLTLTKDKYLLLLGFHDGRVWGLNLIIKSKKKIQQSLVEYLKDADRMPVVKIKVLSRNDKEQSIIIVKSFFLLILTVNKNGEFLRQQHVQLMSFSISSLVVLNESELIVTTQDANLYLASVRNNEISIQDINCDVKTSKVQLLGLANSPSGSMLVRVTSPNCLYDHLITREPSVIHFFYLNGERFDSSNIVFDFNYPYLPWDYLELIRIKASKETDPENHLPGLSHDLKSLRTNSLRIIMWLTLIKEVLKKRKVLKKIDNIIGVISEAQPLIFLHSVCDYITRLLKIEKLTDDMRLSIHFLRLYFEVFLAGEDDENDDFIKKNATNFLNVTQNLDLIETELCNLCGETITELPWNISTCPKGHKLPRCALTLLQITCIKYRSCSACGRIYHPMLDSIYDDVRCLYCDVTATYDDRIIGIYDNIEKKYPNLSTRPHWDQQVKAQISESEIAMFDDSDKKPITFDSTNDVNIL